MRALSAVELKKLMTCTQIATPKIDFLRSEHHQVRASSKSRRWQCFYFSFGLGFSLVLNALIFCHFVMQPKSIWKLGSQPFMQLEKGLSLLHHCIHHMEGFDLFVPMFYPHLALVAFAEATLSQTQFRVGCHCGFGHLLTIVLKSKKKSKRPAPVLGLCVLNCNRIEVRISSKRG